MITRSETKGKAKKDPIRYIKAHQWIKKHKPKCDACEKCGSTNRRLAYANLSQKYMHEVSDWKCLCPICHVMHDHKNSVFHRKTKKSNQYCWEWMVLNQRELKKIVETHSRQKGIGEDMSLRNYQIILDWASLKFTYAQIAKKNGLQQERVRQLASYYSYKVSSSY